jgi:hypothetical protein
MIFATRNIEMSQAKTRAKCFHFQRKTAKLCMAVLVLLWAN